MKSALLAGTLLALIVNLSSAAFADSITNGSFETGNFSGWSTIGDTLVVNASFGVIPAGGQYQALMSTAPDQCCTTDYPNPGYPLQPNGTFSGTVSSNTLLSQPGSPTPFDSFFGLPGEFGPGGIFGTLPPGCLGGSGSPCSAWEGSGIKGVFSANAGDVLSFNFDYLSNDLPFDYAFVVLDGTPSYLIGSTGNGACTLYPFIPLVGSPSSPTGFTEDCGQRLYQTTLTSGGVHTIGIGIVDTGTDPGVNSAILVDNVQLTPIPEPSTWFLLASGLVGIVIVKRRRISQTNV